MPCSANAFASAVMAALIAATAAKAGFGSRAALPDINTTEPFDFLSASQASIVTRRAPCSLSSVPARHCSSVISNKPICGTAPGDIQQRINPAEAIQRGLDESSGRLDVAQIEIANQRLRSRTLYGVRRPRLAH